MEAAEEYEGILNGVQEIIDKGMLVIVEGKKDKKALEELGVKRILVLDVRYKTVEKVMNEKEVVLLVDLDEEGKKIYHELKRELMRFGVNVDDRLRKFLFKNTKVRQIEGLARYLERIS